MHVVQRNTTAGTKDAPTLGFKEEFVEDTEQRKNGMNVVMMDAPIKFRLVEYARVMGQRNTGMNAATKDVTIML